MYFKTVIKVLLSHLFISKKPNFLSFKCIIYCLPFNDLSHFFLDLNSYLLCIYLEFKYEYNTFEKHEYKEIFSKPFYI